MVVPSAGSVDHANPSLVSIRPNDPICWVVAVEVAVAGRFLGFGLREVAESGITQRCKVSQKEIADKPVGLVPGIARAESIDDKSGCVKPSCSKMRCGTRTPPRESLFEKEI